MKRLAPIVLALAGILPASGEDIPPMILARQPSSVWRSPTHYRVTYPEGRSETWWYSSNGVYQVNGQIYRARVGGYEGPHGERYRKIGTSWERMGTNRLLIRRDSSFSYSVGTSRYAVAGSGVHRVSSSPFPQAKRKTNTVIRMKNSHPSAFHSSR
jgi:hypothetical protein